MSCWRNGRYDSDQAKAALCICVKRVFNLACLLGLLLCVTTASASDSSLMKRFRLHPRYTSAYASDRATKRWNQGLSMIRESEWANLSTDLTTSNTERMRREDNQGAFSLILERDTDFGALKMDNSLFRKRITNNTGYTLEKEDNIGFGSVWRKGTTESSSLLLDLVALYIRSEDIDFKDKSTKYTRDETKASGFGAKLHGAANWVPSKELSLKSVWDWENSAEETRSVSIEESATTMEREVQENIDRYRVSGVSIDGKWTRYRKMQLALKSKYNNSYDQYFYAQEDAQDTKEMLRANTMLAMMGDLTKKFSYETSFSIDHTKNRFDIKTTSNKKLHNVSGDLGLSYQASLPLLNDVQFDVGYEAGNKRTDSRSTQQDKKSRKISYQIDKNLSQNLSLTYFSSESLVQDMNDDLVNDKDTHHSTYSFTGRYVKDRIFRSVVYYKVDNQDQGFMSDDKAAQSYAKEDYIINADYAWTLPRGFELKQTVKISSTYSVYKFDDDQNSLYRQNRVSSMVSAPLLPRSRLSLKHLIDQSDQGHYIKPTGGGLRKYQIGTRKLTQTITANVTYEINKHISVVLEEQLSITHSEKVAEKIKTFTEKDWLSAKVIVKRTLPENIGVDATIERREGTKEIDTYWKITAGINKRF